MFNPNQKFQVEVDPTEDTEWNDILRAKGIIPEREPSPSAQLEEMISDAIEAQKANRFTSAHFDNLTKAELEELQDDMDDGLLSADEEDATFLAQYQAQRMQQLRLQAKEAKYGDVLQLQKVDWAKEITQGSKDCYVLVHLSHPGKLQSRLVSELFRQAAPKFKELKFCEIEGKRAIENYPDENCPTILIYHNGDVLKQYIGLTMLRGNDTKLRDLEDKLVELGVFKEQDVRLFANQEYSDDETYNKGALRGKVIMGNGFGSDESDSDFFD